MLRIPRHRAINGIRLSKVVYELLHSMCKPNKAPGIHIYLLAKFHVMQLQGMYYISTRILFSNETGHNLKCNTLYLSTVYKSQLKTLKAR